MAEEEKRSDDDKPGEGEEARPEDAKSADGGERPESASAEEGQETKEGQEAKETQPTPTGTSKEVEAASPLEPTPGITQDSDSAAAEAEPSSRQGEEHAGASHEGHDDHGLSHTTTLQLLFGVFGALTILTILTVAVTGVDLGSQGNFVVAMIIATIKACLVMAFFMHMLWDSKFNVTVFVSSFLFVLLFLTMSLADRGEYQETIDSWETANIAEEG